MQNIKVSEYQLIYSCNPHTLAKHINEKIRGGWIPLGSLIADGTNNFDRTGLLMVKKPVVKVPGVPKKFKIVTAWCPYVLNVRVNELLNKGWFLYGTCVSDSTDNRTSLKQAMVFL